MIMKKSIFITVFLLAGVICNAQQGGAAFFKTGYLYAGGSAGVFQQIGNPFQSSFTNNYMMVGIEGYYRTGKKIVSWEGYAAQQLSSSVGKTAFTEPFLTA